MKILAPQKYWFRGCGIASHVFGLAEALRARGHELIPFSVAYKRTEPSPWSDFFVSPPVGEDVAFLGEAHLTPVTMAKLLGRATYSTETYRKALALVDATKPDIAYVHNIYSYMSPSMLHAFKRRGLPIVMCLHDYFLICAELHLLRDGKTCMECTEHGFKRALRYRCCKGSLPATAARVFSMYVHRWLRIYDTVDLFVTPSRYMKQVMVDAGYDEDKILDLLNFVPLPEEADWPEENYVLYFGRVSPEKGIETLIRAFHQLPQGNDLRLIIAGRGHEVEIRRLKQVCEDIGVRGVEFVGHQEPEALHELLSRCLFTVLPSVWYENSPRSVLESLAYGKPVVGSDIGGIPEQVTPECGVLFEPGNVSALAESMATLLGSRALRRRMGQAARERIRERYSVEAHCANLLSAFEGVLAAQTGPRLATANQ